MFAIVKTGGKQYRVTEGSVIRTEKVLGEDGDTIGLHDVLMVCGDDLKVGTPFVPGAKVMAQIVSQFRDKKVIVFKKTRRHNYRRKKGHRQHLSILKVSAIVLDESEHS
jgi:large subunit ribosomal protein L21